MAQPDARRREGPLQLKRRLTLPILTLYGLGTTVGAGIYVLVGKVAGRSELFTPAAFLVAALLAGLTALSFAELSARFPKSAGEAVYVLEGLRSRRLSLLVGLLVALAGVVAAAAIAVGSVGYILQFLGLPPKPTVAVVVLLLGAIAAWGIAESALTAAVLTLVEIGGLLLIIVVGAQATPDIPQHLGELVPPPALSAWTAIFAGAVLAFYAFIGFEDMVNVAEEVKDVSRNLPLAIVLTLAITTIVYLCVTVVAVLAVAPAELAASDAPLALIYERASGREATAISLIAIFATINGALIQMIMASRVLYGLSRAHELPGPLGRVHPVTRTPLIATLLVTLLIGLLTVLFPIETLAEATSAITLTVFSLVNLALLQLKRRGPTPANAPRIPAVVPLAGLVISVAFLGLEGLRLVGEWAGWSATL